MDQKKIGRFIAELRKEKGMTQKNLAEKIFMTDKAALLYQNRKSKSVSQMSAISLRVNLCA